MKKSDAPIGVFDSGIGGLTVAREIMRNLPMEKIVYFGDTARVPYGNKSKATVVRYSLQIAGFLRTQGIKALVIACNTATSMALEEVADYAEMPVIGVVAPGARVAAETTRNGRIGVIGTRATIGTNAYTNAIHSINPSLNVIGQACPLLVPLVEEGWLHDHVTDEILMRYLDDLLEHDIDTLILGCTHYPLLRSTIKRLVGSQITLVNPAYETAKELERLLAQEGLSSDVPRSQKEPYPYRFFVSDEAEKFTDFANSILPVDVTQARMVPIEEYG